MAPKAGQGYHHGDLRAALVRAARRVVEAEGEGALSLRAAARGAGVSHAAPYNHFADKRALMAAVAQEGFEELREVLNQAVVEETGPEDRLLAVGLAYLRFAETRPGLYRLMFGPAFALDSPAGVDDAGERAFAVLRECVSALAAARGREPDAKELNNLAFMRWAQVHGLAMLHLDGWTRACGTDVESLLAAWRPGGREEEAAKDRSA